MLGTNFAIVETSEDYSVYRNKIVALLFINDVAVRPGQQMKVVKVGGEIRRRSVESLAVQD
jgi:hypothetical protein